MRKVFCKEDFLIFNCKSWSRLENKLKRFLKCKLHLNYGVSWDRIKFDMTFKWAVLSWEQIKYSLNWNLFCLQKKYTKRKLFLFLCLKINTVNYFWITKTMLIYTKTFCKKLHLKSFLYNISYFKIAC